MKMAMLIEYDNPKDEVRIKKVYEQDDLVTPFWQKKVKEGLVKNLSNWADNTGHIIIFVEFESGEKLGKFLSDGDFHQIAMKAAESVDNLTYRVLRPAVHAQTGKPMEL